MAGIKTAEDHLHTVGPPDAAVRESRDRVRSALRNCGYDIPASSGVASFHAPAKARVQVADVSGAVRVGHRDEPVPLRLPQ